MIIDVNEPTVFTHQAIIFLDGKRQRFCTYVDDRRGIVRRYAKTHPESVFRHPFFVHSIETVRGRVQIWFPERLREDARLAGWAGGRNPIPGCWNDAAGKMNRRLP